MHNKLHTLEEWTKSVAPKYPQESRVLRKCARMRGPICGPFNSYCVGAGWRWCWVGKPIMVQRPGVWLLAACWCIVTRGRAQPSQQRREEMVRRLFYDKWAWPLELATKVWRSFKITEKGSWLKAPISTFTFKNLLRHYAKWALIRVLHWCPNFTSTHLVRHPFSIVS